MPVASSSRLLVLFLLSVSPCGRVRVLPRGAFNSINNSPSFAYSAGITAVCPDTPVILFSSDCPDFPCASSLPPLPSPCAERLYTLGLSLTQLLMFSSSLPVAHLGLLGSSREAPSSPPPPSVYQRTFSHQVHLTCPICLPACWLLPTPSPSEPFRAHRAYLPSAAWRPQS